MSKVDEKWLAVEGSYHRRVYDLMVELGFKPIEVKDAEHSSRVAFIFQDELGQYKTRLSIIDFANDDESMGGLERTEIEGIASEVCIECGLNPKIEYDADEAECVRSMLDESNVPKVYEGRDLSLVGRTLLLAGKMTAELGKREVHCPSCKGIGYRSVGHHPTGRVGNWRKCEPCKGTGKESWFAEADREREKAYPFLKEPCSCGASLSIYCMGAPGEDRTFAVSCRGAGCKNDAHSEKEFFSKALDAVNAWNKARRDEAKAKKRKGKPKRKIPRRMDR